MTQILTIARVGMATYGIGYIILGITWIALPVQSRISGIGWVGWLTPGIVGAGFVIVAALAITNATISKRLPQLSKVTWLALTAMPGILAAYFLVAWVGYLLPMVESDAKRGIASTASYLLIAGGAAGMSRVSQIAHRLQDRWESV